MDRIWNFIRRNARSAVVLVVLVVIAIAVILQVRSAVQSSAPTATSATPGSDWMFWVAAIVFIVGAIAAILGHGGAAARWALGIVVLLLGVKLLSGFVFGDNAPEVEKAVQREISKSILSSNAPAKGGNASTVYEKVVAENITVPARGREVVKKKLRCYLNSTGELYEKYVTRTVSEDDLIFTSTHSDPITVRVWFHNEGGECGAESRRIEREGRFK